MQFDQTENFLTKTSNCVDLNELKTAMLDVLKYAHWPDVPLLPSELETISINLKRIPSILQKDKWHSLSGRIVDVTSGARLVNQHEFTVWNEEVPRYIKKIVRKLERAYNFQSGRVRLCNLRSLQCLRSHSDHEQRFHLAITTNPGVFFYNVTQWQPNPQYYSIADLKNFSGVGYHIPADGFFYKSYTMLPHTAVNTGKDDRIHLVVDICPSNQLQ